MSKEDRGRGWDSLARQVGGNPWDWVAAGIGGLAGAGVSLASHGLDLGTSIPTGATISVTVRKAAGAAAQGFFLKRRVRAFLARLRKECKSPAIAELAKRMRRELDMFEERITTVETLENELDQALELYRNIGTPGDKVKAPQ